MKNFIQILIYFIIIFTIYTNVFAKENIEDIIVNGKYEKYLYSTEFNNFEMVITNLPKENNLLLKIMKIFIV